MKPTPLSPELTHQIYQRVGLRAHSSNEDRLAEWISERSQQLTLASPEAYLDWLAEPLHLLQEREALSQLLTSRETYFLRDRGVVDLLRDHILKDTLARKMTEQSIHIWSVGCSTGEEAYTLSILLEEAIPNLNSWQVDILGSDIDQIALHKARQGAYRQWSFRGCPPEFIARYFHQEGSHLEIMDHIKQRVRFEQLDIVGEPFPTEHKGMAHADIILCRNVFIYLNDAAIQTALKKLTACLNEDGYLLCGPGELHAQEHPQLVPLIFPQALIYQKKKMSAQLAVAAPFTSLKPPPVLTRGFTPKPTLTGANIAQPISLENAWAQANRGNIAAANTLCDTLIQRHPFDPHPHYLHAVLHFAQGMNTQARTALRRVLYLDPLFAVAYAMLSDVCMADDDTVCAMKACEQGLKATSIQAEELPVPYFKAVTFLEFRQHLQDRIATLRQ